MEGFPKNIQAMSKIIEGIFFDAMLEGYANPKAEKAPFPGLPGSKSITYKDGDFTVIDCYFVREGSDASHGFTLITFKDVPIWIMRYGGWYKKEVIPFLKSALMAAYRERQFFGGRGPIQFMNEEKTLVYQNSGDLYPFSNFHSSEQIRSIVDGKLLGFHECSGGLFFDKTEKEG